MRRFALFPAALLAATPAFAQPADAPVPLPDPADRSDTLTIGVGAAWIPDYEGSDDYRIIPAAALRARVSGISIFTRSTYLYADVIPRGSGKLDFDFGPIAGVRLNRTGKVDDRLVDRLPERNTAVELGGFAGITLHGLTNPYDSLSVRFDLVKDVAGAHGGTILTPTIDFGTPLSRTLYVGTSLSADFAGDRYADYYFSVTPAGSLASGLPVYRARGGLKSWRLGLLANQSLSGDLTRGWSIFATGGYSRLRGDFKRSPIVRDRGSARQWLAAIGISYTW
jgi:MipA family protein